jgi:ABC-2 type transport system ATP-binding protein
MTAPFIRIRQLSHSYDKAPVLHQLSTELYSGEIIAVLGANGAGKTTLIQLLLGLLCQQQGEIEILGQAPAQIRRDPRFSGQLGVMLQQASLPGQLTVLEQLRLFSAYYPAPLPLPTLIKRFGLQSFLQQRCSSLSGGQRQSLLLALALLGQPKILFLDEPTVGMDVEARQRFWQLIRTARAEGLCILLTTHYLEEADALADRILLLKDGRFIADTSPAALKAGLSQRQIRCFSSLTPETLQQLPGVSAVVPLNGQQVQISSSQVEECLRQLLQQDPQLCDLTVSAASLEQAFLQLTQEETH